MHPVRRQCGGRFFLDSACLYTSHVIWNSISSLPSPRSCSMVQRTRTGT